MRGGRQGNGVWIVERMATRLVEEALRLTLVIAMAINAGCLVQASGYREESEITSPNWIHLSSKTGDLPVPGRSNQQSTSLILDVDRDGVSDFVIASRKMGPAVVWYRRDSSGWTKYLIDGDVLPIEAGGAYHDIDQDGDLDLVFGGDSESNEVWWWENPYPNYDREVPWKRRQIKNSGARQHHDQILGDFDGNGKAELVFWNQGDRKLFVADIPADPKGTQPWPYREIFTAPSPAEGLAKADIDGDGTFDLVAGNYWLSHEEGNHYSAHMIRDDASALRVAAGQLKRGGWAEVVSVPAEATGRLKWYEWSGTTWVGHDLLGFDVDHGHSLEVADINGDGNLDIFCAEMVLAGNPHAKAWIFFGNGEGQFKSTLLASGYDNHESRVGDLDGDGDLDILGKPYDWDTPRLDIWLNGGTRLQLNHWSRHVIDDQKPWRTLFITAGDLDGDNHTDIITGAWWYKNPGSPSKPWARRVIAVPLNNMATVYDFDGDGDLDILGTKGQGSEPNASFVWARNNGSGTFSVFPDVAKGDGDLLQGTAVARFQGPLEVALSWHISGKGIQVLTVPRDPAAGEWPWRQISEISQDEALSPGDIDRDGDQDLLLGTKWFRNEGSWWSEQTLRHSSDSPDRNRLADINGDGRLDAVIGFEAISKKGLLAWYEQGSHSTAPWSEHVIATVIGPMSLDVADMDGDGDLDVVVGEHNLENPSIAKLYVYENADGRGSRWKEHVVYTGDEHHDGAQVVDIDGDGDLDIISIGWGHNQVLLYENMALQRRAD